MPTFIALLLSGGVAITALAAAIVVHGGWEAGAAGLGTMAGLAFLLSLSALVATGDRPRPRGRRARAV